MLERGITWVECWIKMVVLVSRTDSQLPPCFCSKGRVQHFLAWLFESIFFDFWNVFGPVCRLCSQLGIAPSVCQGTTSGSACSYWKSQVLSIARTDKLGFGGLGAVASLCKTESAYLWHWWTPSHSHPVSCSFLRCCWGSTGFENFWIRLLQQWGRDLLLSAENRTLLIASVQWGKQ